LRELRKKNGLRQVDLASALNLAQTTIANYEQNSRFPDEKTLLKIADFFDTTLDYLLGRADIDARYPSLAAGGRSTFRDTNHDETLPPLADEYMKILLDGDRKRASRLILDAARSGLDVKTIYLTVLEPALREVGRMWSRSEINVAREHYFSTSTQTIMSQLYDYIETAPRNGHSVVAVAVGGDLHEIGIRMVTDFLEMEGWDSYLLGANVPVEHILRALKDRKADLLAVSATMIYNVDAVTNLIKAVRSDENCRRVRVMVGGLAFNRDDFLWREVGADGFARDAEDAVRVAIELVSDQKTA
jgi:methanogenic corrinoid protein MtbC1/DNA-binding XRE family transcriptional regulator